LVFCKLNPELKEKDFINEPFFSENQNGDL
jgi:hypothetical protein